MVDLRSVTNDMLPLVGGKAVGLGVLLAAEFPVPNGFCIPTSAYREAVPVAEILRTFPSDLSDAEAETAASEAQRLVLQVELPEGLTSAIAQALDRLTNGGLFSVAVRSSATTEDLPDASFAGQHDTYLGVRGLNEVLDSVRRCWASLWSERAVLYRAGNAIDHREAEIAVVVQLMVDAEQAGVLFTVDPTNEHRQHMLIEAVEGLGESLVSGAARPDRYRVGPGGVPVSSGGDLTSPQLRQLWSLGSCVEAFFEAPQDIEWAIDDLGELWITQSRSITTLFPVPDTSYLKPRVYWSLNAYQGMTRPFTPIGAHMLRLRQMAFQPGLVASGIGREIPNVDGWLYWDVTDGAYSESRRAKIAGLIDAFTAPSGKALLDYSDELRPASGSDPLRFTPLLKNSIKKIPTALSLAFPNLARARIMRQSERLIQGFFGPRQATSAERLVFVESVEAKVARIELDLPREPGARRATDIALQLLAGIADEAALNPVFRGVSGNPTTEMDLALWRLSMKVRVDPTANALFQKHSPRELADTYIGHGHSATIQTEVSEFLSQYGFRAKSEIDLGVPRWADDPEPVFAMITNYLRTTDSSQGAEQRFAEAAQAAETAIGQLTAPLRERAPARAWAARFMLRRSRALRGLREHGKVYLMRGFAAIREQLVLVGEDLVREGKLDHPEDVMFLVPAEMRDALSGREVVTIVRERRATYERESRRPRVPVLVFSDGRELLPQPQAVESCDSTRLLGLAAASGTTTGSARVVHDARDVHLEPGEILVVTSTDPGWTPLFLTAGALVSESGGLTSHGTTVAREYGIPAVVGVVDATRVIHTGDTLTVDGASGTVLIHSRPSEGSAA